MKPYTFVVFALFWMVFADAQTRRMAFPDVGKTQAGYNQRRTAMPLLQQAERQLQTLDYQNTFFTLENAVAQNPYSPEALLLRAKFKQLTGMEAEAEIDYQNAQRLNPYVADLYGYHGTGGLLRLLSFQPQQAVQGLNTFQKLNYYYDLLDQRTIAGKTPLEEITFLEQVIRAIETEQLSEADELLTLAYQDFPSSALVYDLSGLLLTKQGQYKSAAAAFAKAVELDPDFAIAWYNRGQVEQTLGNLSKAKTYLDRAIELQEDLTKAYFARAQVLKAMGDKEDALADYNTVISIQGETYAEAYLNRGLTKKMLGRYSGALADLNKVIDEFPNQPDLYKNRGNLYLLLRLTPKALMDYSKAIQLDENYAEAYYNRALAHFLQYDKISGCADLERSQELEYAKAIEIAPYFCTE